MKRGQIFFFFLFIGSLLLSAQNHPAIEQLLEIPSMKGATFSLVVKEVESGKTVWRHDAGRLVSPASVLKLVTTATALELLGTDYRFPTTIEYDGTIDNGLLRGNLYIRGSGDPSLGSSHLHADDNAFLAAWISAIKKAGIRHIEGAVMADERIFDIEGVSPKWLKEDVGNYFAAGSYGVSVFDNLYKLSFTTGPVGGKITINRCIPEMPALHFHNYLQVTASATDSAYIAGFPFSNERYLYGTLPPNRTDYQIKGDLPDPPAFLAEYLTRQLKSAGIQIDGKPSCFRIEQEKGCWKNMPRKALITTYSPPLKELVRICNFVSHNLYADAFMKTIGLQYKPAKSEKISSLMRGVAVSCRYWAGKGVDISGLRIYDGSGLSPMDKVTADFLCNVLVYMDRRSAASAAFSASLPRAGIEGSVRNFMKGSSLQGYARLKSGGLSGVRGYAGYIRKEGKTYAIVVFSNNYSCSMSEMSNRLGKLIVQLF